MMNEIRKIIRNIIREQLMASPKYYIYASPTTNFPYEEDGQEDLEAQDEIIKMATAMGMEPSKGYIATPYLN
jgi:hypothetical protein